MAVLAHTTLCSFPHSDPPHCFLTMRCTGLCHNQDRSAATVVRFRYNLYIV